MGLIFSETPFISQSISAKVWDRTGIELTTPESAVRQVSAVMLPTALCGTVYILVYHMMLCLRVK